MHNNLDPEKIEDLLRNVPKIKDTRSKEDVFARLKADGAFEEEVNQPNQDLMTTIKKPVPFFKIASFVAVFALVIAATVMIYKSDRSLTDLADSNAGIELSSDKAEIMDTDDSAKSAESAESAGSEMYSMESMMRTGDYRKGLYEDELVDQIVFTIGMASNAAESVPISMKIPLLYLEENGLDSNASYLQIYELIAPLIDEQALGFSKFHPLLGRFEETGEQLIHYLPDDHSYDIASAAISNYFGVLNDTFGSHYKEVLLRNNNGEPIEFSEIGEMNEPIVLNGMESRMNYFLLEQNNGVRYLSPNFRKSYPTIIDAFATLKDEWNDIYKTAMINGVDFELENRGTYTAVKFLQPLNVTEYETDELMYMLEAIIATATSFGQQVKFENVVQDEWGGFRFTEVIPQLMGVNEIDFPL